MLPEIFHLSIFHPLPKLIRQYKQPNWLMHLLLHLSNLLRPLLGPKKKISPLDDIRKDPDVLYALLKLKWKEEEATDNHGLEYELSSKASVTNNPYYPYNRELFGHD